MIIAHSYENLFNHTVTTTHRLNNMYFIEHCYAYKLILFNIKTPVFTQTFKTLKVFWGSCDGI